MENLRDDMQMHFLVINNSAKQCDSRGNILNIDLFVLTFYRVR